MDYQWEFVDFMVRSNVLTFGDFTTKSGRKTPYFVNTGNYKTGAQICKLGKFYAACIINNIGKNFDLLFGPAYKGIPLSVAASISLYQDFDFNIPFCFNRKEAKDHGEGGSLIGYAPKDGDRVVIIEDVITAGTSVRESIALLNAVAKVEITSLVVSVDRMEKGTGQKTALQELQETYRIKTFPIVTIREIYGYLHNREIDGRVVIDDEMKAKVEEYLKVYGINT